MHMNAFVIKHMVVFINVKHFSLVDMGQNGLFGRGEGLGAAYDSRWCTLSVIIFAMVLVSWPQYFFLIYCTVVSVLTKSCFKPDIIL